ncbi:response regulator [Deinococcus radiopugnans]|uniref:Transcriptional regulatory protein n=1 Tax=Deinococcus radiopugnans ATCC 19172 TaxID=585398 RepID=A0A5C4Y8Z8_9DEIO|nr:response regulator [Deinococcus radiopugnans]MBB6016063.1 response regulator of citrate/malate metabolism [Deinococcus radiopugnans ATCC 19172]TNM72095.1 response regulator [Deinococcus radiopugnans ATCC 19172]
MSPEQWPVRVLLVEDDVRVARVNRDLLERDPAVHVVGSAASCAQGDALARALQPDLILLDVHLPDGSGLGLLHHWRAAGILTDVALITAADDEPSVRLALAHGAFDYLIKPFTGARLAELVARHRARRPTAAGGPRLDQAELDRVLNVTSSASESLPRGIDPHTLERVAAALRDAQTSVSAEELGERVGLSRVTAWRYLEHLVRVGEATLDHVYGQSGRPAKLYRAARV